MSSTGILQPVGNSGLRVLVVDDDDLVRSLAVRVLAREGHHPLEAADGAQAEQLLAVHPGAIDAALLDLRMQPPAGLALVEQVRLRLPRVGVVVWSGSGPEPGQRAELDRLGVRFLRKPFAPAEMIDALSEAVARVREQR